MSERERGSETIALRPIGVIRTPHQLADKTPIQPMYARGVEGRAEVLPGYAEGLRDLDGFSHVYLVYLFHQAGPSRLVVKPFLDDVERGVFATRAPCRPNPIGLSVVRLVRRQGNVLYVEDVDMLDNTPLLDIKPFVAWMDLRENTRCGWLEGIDAQTAEDRGRRMPEQEAEGS
jgi:tRNA-Thr(GGU) m(6)t(6)A37 methyltransferase TsaA